MKTEFSLQHKPIAKERILKELHAQGVPTHTPCVKITITSETTPNLTLDPSAVSPVLSNFGEITSLRVFNSVILVLYKEITSAYYAQKLLNGRKFKELGLTVQVSWYSIAPTVPEEPTTQAPLSAKYTCRFDIQIENDKKFQIARRLIGHKGCNMKRILQHCSGQVVAAHNSVKIRLRGKGSGFKEGPEQTESEEPLHLCISSTFKEKFEVALTEIEALLKQIYHEYSEYCRGQGREAPKLLVKRQQNSPAECSLDRARLSVLEQSHRPSQPEVEELIEIRNEARRQCNFAEADRIRELLKEKDILLMDEKGARGRGGEVTTWKYWH